MSSATRAPKRAFKTMGTIAIFMLVTKSNSSMQAASGQHREDRVQFEQRSQRLRSSWVFGAQAKHERAAF